MLQIAAKDQIIREISLELWRAQEKHLRHLESLQDRLQQPDDISKPRIDYHDESTRP